ncbi:MAG: protease complex subunit PrcB family protein [Bacillaceae bacterium]|nr:protease complex subunit PrcB family protein [Bacillaceae bacterium]
MNHNIKWTFFGLLIPILVASMLLGDTISAFEGKEKQMAPSKNIQVKHVELDQAPGEIQQWVKRHRHDEGTYVKHQGDRTYLLVSWGEKKTGGYTVNIDSIEEYPDKLVVHVSYQKPDGMVIQVITYPFDLVSIPKTDKEIVFEKI